MVKDAFHDVEEVSADLKLDVISAALNVEHVMAKIVAPISNTTDKPVSNVSN